MPSKSFNEQTLREEIIRVWGPAGAHIDVYDELLRRARVSALPPEQLTMMIATNVEDRPGFVSALQPQRERR